MYLGRDLEQGCPKHSVVCSFVIDRDCHVNALALVSLKNCLGVSVDNPKRFEGVAKRAGCNATYCVKPSET